MSIAGLPNASSSTAVELLQILSQRLFGFSGGSCPRFFWDSPWGSTRELAGEIHSEILRGGIPGADSTGDSFKRFLGIFSQLRFLQQFCWFVFFFVFLFVSFYKDCNSLVESVVVEFGVLIFGRIRIGVFGHGMRVERSLLFIQRHGPFIVVAQWIDQIRLDYVAGVVRLLLLLLQYFLIRNTHPL